MTRSMLLAVSVVIVVAVCGGTCVSRDSPPSTESSTPIVYTTFPVVKQITKAVTGEAADVRALLDGGKSPHSYEPTPSDARAVGRAAVFVLAADGLDGWAARIAGGKTVTLIDLLPDSLKLVNSAGTTDPHFWLDPVATRAIAAALPDTLCAFLPDDCATFRSNGDLFARELTVLEADIRTAVIPFRSTGIVLTTPFFSYFADRYQLDVAAILSASDAVDPGPKKLVELARRLRAGSVDIGVVVYEAHESAAGARMAAELLGARIVPIDPIGGTRGLHSYRELMMYNVQQLLGAAE